MVRSWACRSSSPTAKKLMYSMKISVVRGMAAKGSARPGRATPAAMEASEAVTMMMSWGFIKNLTRDRRRFGAEGGVDRKRGITACEDVAFCPCGIAAFT